MRKFALAAMLVVVPTLALAQNPQGAQGGAAGGAAAGAVGGAVVGGPVGAVVGGVGGALVGGLIGDNTPRFRQYVVEQQIPSYTYSEEVRVGTVLPEAGVVYREVPPEYGVKGYRYTVINNQPVLVEPQTRRVIQVIE
ncbi:MULTISPECIES: DUF1236 domain-containing protein [unclassified Chelatococcus]|uniref:DUF1236 domain-containing protein n=1 Tax=unclassified Chelatococcus TaxID=2638111 RepID=UPI001BCC534E|nr:MULTISPECIES: DUF1236 domain-containing protein [unclassified Chelatococcus]MBS7699099.1 DUF1236 domain-containing protein [Chelatococcus sp. YT9]MBX3554880.1 DUF1236 domain-containing protein [Chelatococcus sp.]